MPPVSGGSATYTHEIVFPTAGHFFALTRDPIDGGAVARRLLRGEDGAFVNFEGVARNNTKGRATRYLEYECYEAMAVKMMSEIGAEIARSHAIGRIANTVFGDHVPRANNYRVGDAPVSFPPVWDIWKFNWVQYGASVRHPLARNVGESMGVGAKFSFFDAYGRPVPPLLNQLRRYLATAERLAWRE